MEHASKVASLPVGSGKFDCGDVRRLVYQIGELERKVTYLERKMRNMLIPETELQNIVVTDDMLSAMAEFDQEYSFDVNEYARRAFGIKVTESSDVC